MEDATDESSSSSVIRRELDLDRDLERENVRRNRALACGEIDLVLVLVLDRVVLIGSGMSRLEVWIGWSPWPCACK